MTTDGSTAPPQEELIVALPSQLAHDLRRVARQRSQDPAALVRDLLQLVLGAADKERSPNACTTRTLDEILAPVRHAFAASGVSEERLIELIEQARRESAPGAQPGA